MKMHAVNAENAEQMKKKYESGTSLRADSEFSKIFPQIDSPWETV